MTFANPWPWWAIAAFAAAAVTLAAYAYRNAPLTPLRRAALAAVRVAALLLLAVLLMRPVASSGDDLGDVVVPILVDTSRSMGIEDAGGGESRIAAARRLVSDRILPSLGGFKTEVFAIGEALAPSLPDALGAGGRRSDLAGALGAIAERYRGRPVAGVVLISDGGDTGAGSARLVPEASAPVFVVEAGSRSIARDREVLSVTAADAVLDDSRVDLAVSAVSHGHGTAPIELRLLENGRVADVKRASPAADGAPVREVFHVFPAKGAPTVYTVEIPAAAGELVPENNTRSVLVQPPGRARRILLVQGAPGFEHSFLRRAWSGDSGLDVDSVVRKGRNEQGSDTFYVQAHSSRGQMLTGGYPVDRDGLFGYDAIVLANVEGAALTRAQLEATRDFVGRRGGGLLVLGAHSFLPRGLVDTPLEDVLPLDLGQRGGAVVPASAVRGANRVSLTTAGEGHPIMQLTTALEETRKRWDAVPALASIAPLGGPRAGASVLAVTSGPGGTPRALVAVQRYGEGRSMVFTGEASWRWRMMMPSDDRSFDTFWRQAARWLSLPAPEPVAIRGPAGAAAGDVLPLRVDARNASFEPLGDASVDVRVTRPDGGVEAVPAAVDTGGAHVALYRTGDAGVYRVTAEVRRPGAAPVTATTSLLVGGADPEMTDPRVNVHVLERIAAASGGRLVAAADAGSLAAELRRATPQARLLARRDLWHNGWSFMAIAALLTAEWLLRRRWGLR